jgi:hypothetical protein
MPLQTTYTQYQPEAVVGGLVNGENFNAIGKHIASADVAFGAPVQRGSGLQCATLASGGEFLGIARRKLTGTADRYLTTENVAIIDEGVIYVLADAAITAGPAVNFNTATGRFTQAATSGTVLAVPNAEADSSAAAAGATFKLRLRRIPS